jgi:hypothetical protein
VAAIYVVWGSTSLTRRVMVESMPPLLAASAWYIAAGDDPPTGDSTLGQPMVAQRDEPLPTATSRLTPTTPERGPLPGGRGS